MEQLTAAEATRQLIEVLRDIALDVLLPEFEEDLGQAQAKLIADQLARKLGLSVLNASLATSERTRESLMTDARLIEIVRNEMGVLSKALGLDAEQVKEVYRSMLSTCIQVMLTIAREDQS